MGRDIRLRAAAVAAAISVMTVITIGVFMYLIDASRDDDRRAECVEGITAMLPGMQMSAREVEDIIRQCEEDPDGVTTAWLSRYLKQIAETK